MNQALCISLNRCIGSCDFEGKEVKRSAISSQRCRHKNNDVDDLRGIKSVDEFFNRDDRVFSAVGARHKSQDRTALFHVDDDDGSIGNSVDPSVDS